MRPKAILLDMDDTLIAYEQGIDVDQCWRFACSKHLPSVQEDARERLVKEIKKHARWYWSDAERHRLGRLDLDKARTEIVTAAFQKSDMLDATAATAQRIAVDFGTERNHAVTLFPEAIETLQYLREELGIKLALLTNGNANGQRRKIERFGLAPYFDCILIEEEFGVGKPEPGIYEHAMKQLAVSAEETWMIGDNYEWEILAPQKLGIRGIWVSHSREQDPDGEAPYRTIGTISELKALLASVG